MMRHWRLMGVARRRGGHDSQAGAAPSHCVMSGMGGGVLEANLNPNIPGGGNLIGPLEAPGS